MTGEPYANFLLAATLRNLLQLCATVYWVLSQMLSLKAK